MALGDNGIIPLYRPGTDLTARATAAIAAGKFVRFSGAFEGGPLLDVSTPLSPLTGGNNFRVSLCGAAARASGVAAWDTAADGDKVLIYGPGEVVPMVAGAAITGGDEVESNASGNPIPLASGRPNGQALATAGNGATVYVRLY
jgi:hypothetical protein